MRAIRALLAALLFATAGFVTPTGATSANTDLSDIWWNPNESGWGMQMVNTGTFVFATIYVYGPNGAPTWYTGQLTTIGGGYAGPLYATVGPYFGGFFNPNAVSVRQVGTMRFTGTNLVTGQLTYSVDGVVVNKSVQRQPVTLDDYSGDYAGVTAFTASGCFNPANNGSGTDYTNISIRQNGQSIAVLLTGGSSTTSCSFVGTYSQFGRMGGADGTFSCTNGGGGPATFSEMTNAGRMFMARVRSQGGDGCIEEGEISGVFLR